MTKFQVRVMRDMDGEYADIEVEANTAEEAKKAAVTEAYAKGDQYFGELPKPDYFADPSMEPEEVPEGGFA